MRKVLTSATLALATVAVMLVAAGATEAKGPKASLLSATECALDLGVGSATLVVTTTLTNQSSGNVIAEVREGGEIEGTYKAVGSRGNTNTTFDTAPIEYPEVVDPQLTITEEFDICDVFEDARELNAKATVNYGVSGGDGAMRTVMNRCTDDPDTLDVDEGSIKVEDFFDQIEAACATVACPCQEGYDAVVFDPPANDCTAQTPDRLLLVNNNDPQDVDGMFAGPNNCLSSQDGVATISLVTPAEASACLQAVLERASEEGVECLPICPCQTLFDAFVFDPMATTCETNSNGSTFLVNDESGNSDAIQQIADRSCGITENGTFILAEPTTAQEASACVQAIFNRATAVGVTCTVF